MKNLNKRLGINENYSSYHVVTMDCLKPQHAYIFSIDNDYGVHIFQEVKYKAEEIRFAKLEELEFIKIHRRYLGDIITFILSVLTYLCYISENIKNTASPIPIWTFAAFFSCVFIAFIIFMPTKIIKLKTKSKKVFECQYTTSPLSKKKWKEYKELKNKVKIINSQCTL